LVGECCVVSTPVSRSHPHPVARVTPGHQNLPRHSVNITTTALMIDETAPGETAVDLLDVENNKA